MSTEFPSNRAGTSPATQAFAITPDTDNDLALWARSLYVGTAGDLVVIPADGTASVTFVGVQGIVPVAVRRVLATSTADNIVGLR
jgi:hypothetical protein